MNRQLTQDRAEATTEGKPRSREGGQGGGKGGSWSGTCYEDLGKYHKYRTVAIK
jgi:hypothetical protein